MEAQEAEQGLHLLAPELLVAIFSYSDARSLGRTSCVCKLFRDVIQDRLNDAVLWKGHCPQQSNPMAGKTWRELCMRYTSSQDPCLQDVKELDKLLRAQRPARKSLLGHLEAVPASMMAISGLALIGGSWGLATVLAGWVAVGINRLRPGSFTTSFSSLKHMSYFDKVVLEIGLGPLANLQPETRVFSHASWRRFFTSTCLFSTGLLGSLIPMWLSQRKARNDYQRAISGSHFSELLTRLHSASDPERTRGLRQALGESLDWVGHFRTTFGGPGVANSLAVSSKANKKQFRGWVKETLKNVPSSSPGPIRLRLLLKLYAVEACKRQALNWRSRRQAASSRAGEPSTSRAAQGTHEVCQELDFVVLSLQRANQERITWLAEQIYNLKAVGKGVDRSDVLGQIKHLAKDPRAIIDIPSLLTKQSGAGTELG